MIKHPYVGFAVLYVLVFAFAFSSINNFGILVRQRTQLLPIATVLLCTPSDRTLFWTRRQELLEDAPGSDADPRTAAPVVEKSGPSTSVGLEAPTEVPDPD